ncbi:CRISPR-associated protein [Leptolyngbya sp. 'hensonii']|uniref:TIGR02221 family CRISPR-associated protein n=1 Tax=Leptolyngbya sp. 'hensonii' TaxID=1922337 RepID=UPI00095011D1|nr:TIGR02221 family CRISPR-associated protein [Leptolyngbya sp. 'hensonii']OLP19169.1 CRISPR-associated protein [Leptolyngbya sp. 'hensonii']
MAKILIASLGTGSVTKDGDSLRQYRKATYKIGEELYEETFIASALYQNLKLDRIIFIGTVKSMWEEVYRFFCKAKRVPFDEDYYWELVEKIEALNYQSSLDSLDLSELNKVLGGESKCVLTKYGLNQEELWINFERISQSLSDLEENDQLYIDITHSFRSLPILQFLTITFINDLLSEKKIEIAGIYYGMLEVSRELENITPIVDLKPLFEITTWIKGAYNLKNYGNGELIAELLCQQNEELLAKRIHALSDAIQINYVPDIKQKSSDLKSTLSETVSEGPFKYVRSILENFVNRFSRSSLSESQFQLELADWYFQNKRYSTGYITLAEAVITYVCEVQGRDPKNKDCREEMKEFLCKHNQSTSLYKVFNKVNSIRRGVAHALLEGRTENLKQAIEEANNYQLKIRRIFSKGTLN